MRSLSTELSDELTLAVSSFVVLPSRVSGAETSLIGCTLGINGCVDSRTGRGATSNGVSWAAVAATLLKLMIRAKMRVWLRREKRAGDKWLDLHVRLSKACSICPRPP